MDFENQGQSSSPLTKVIWAFAGFMILAAIVLGVIFVLRSRSAVDVPTYIVGDVNDVVVPSDDDIGEDDDEVTAVVVDPFTSAGVEVDVQKTMTVEQKEYFNIPAEKEMEYKFIDPPADSPRTEPLLVVIDPAAEDFGDADMDRLTDVKEQEYGTDPYNFDTDGDGVWDGDEVSGGSDPLDPRSTPRAAKK